MTKAGLGDGALLAFTSAAGGIASILAGRDPGPGPAGLKFPVDDALYPNRPPLRFAPGRRPNPLHRRGSDETA